MIRLSDTKTSKRKSSLEHAIVESSIGAKVLRFACSKVDCHAPILGMTPKQAYVELKSILNLFSLPTSEFNSYSLRRGGATAYLFSTGSMEKTLVKGRWEAASTARIYIQDAAAHAGQLSLSDVQLALLKRATAGLNRFVEDAGA